MGVTPSVEIQAPSNFSYFGMQFGHTDRLRLVVAPVEVVNATRAVLATYWETQDVRESPGFVEFKLKGTPWSPSKITDINAKYFLCTLIKEYYAVGWHLKCASDLEYRGPDSSAVIFEKLSPLATYVICVSLNESDKIRVLAPDEVVQQIRAAIVSSWPYGIQREQTVEKSFEFKLKGNPWGSWESDGAESYHTVSMMTAIFNNLYQQGWIFASAIDSGNRQYDINSLYFKYDPDELKKPENANARFFGMSLNRTDRVRLINAPVDLVGAVRSSMPTMWPKGIQKETDEYGSYEVKLKGNPWNAHAEETVESRQLVAQLFRLMSQYNWSLYATCTLTKSLSDKSTFFFRQQQQPAVNILSVSLNESDKLRVIGADYERFLPQIRTAIMASWPSGIQSEKPYASSWQFKLKGYPFHHQSASNVYALYMLLMVLGYLEPLGLKLISSADISGKYVTETRHTGQSTTTHESYTVDLDSWFFSYNKSS